ncbi:MAG: acetate--CoA ligase family protein [Hyphomicrobiaceae bacterium]
MTIDSLQPFLTPKNVAIIGASQDPNKIGGRPLHYLKKYGFKGGIWPVNPGRPEVQGVKTFKDLDALPDVPDLALVAVAGDQAVEAVKGCAARGVKTLICITSGFGETGDPEGAAKQQEMVAAARAGGMRMVGPNTQGLANFANGCVASFSTFFTTVQCKDGPIAMVSQSGAMSAIPIGLLAQRGLGVRYSIATGNDADVSVLDMACVTAADPDMKLLLLYLEGMPHADKLADLAEIARKNDVMVVALKSGRTDAGARAAASHTGALANEDRVVDAAFKRVGIWRAENIAELVSNAEVYLKGWKPKGRRFVTISGSGATGVMSADHATHAGLEVVNFAPDTRKKLDAILPSFASAANPIDLTAALLTNNGLLGEILPVIASSDAADMFKVDMPVAGPGYDMAGFAKDIAGFSRDTGRPVVVAGWQDDIPSTFRNAGVPVFPLEYEAIQGLAQLAGHHELVDIAKARPRPAWNAYDPGIAKRRQVTLNEAESLGTLAKGGLPVVPHHLAKSAAEAATAWRNLGGPVAVKGCSADLPHKSEYGLVRLGLDDEDQIRQAFRDMEKAVEKANAKFDGAIVARMVKGRREMLIGAHRDPFFGPVIVVGEGGKYVEAMPDLALLLPPFSTDDVLRALKGLRCGPVLAGVRGEPPMDVNALADAAVKIADVMLKDPGIASVDMNPVMLNDKGSGVALVDAVVVRYEASCHTGLDRTARAATAARRLCAAPAQDQGFRDLDRESVNSTPSDGMEQWRGAVARILKALPIPQMSYRHLLPVPIVLRPRRLR